MSTTGVLVTVGTFNVHHGVGADGLDLARTADTIARMDADVVAVQELDRCWSTRSDFVDQAEALAGRLALHMAFGAALQRRPAEPGRRLGQYGVALLSRHRLVDTRETLLPCPRGGEQRTLLSAEVHVGGARLRCLATHLQHRSRTERIAQVAAILATLDGGQPTVLLGDLNARPRSPEVGTLTEKLDDAWVVGGQGTGHTYTARRPYVRIDYVLTSPEVRVGEARVVDSDASDHLPVTADVTVPVL